MQPYLALFWLFLAIARDGHFKFSAVPRGLSCHGNCEVDIIVSHAFLSNTYQHSVAWCWMWTPHGDSKGRGSHAGYRQEGVHW